MNSHFLKESTKHINAFIASSSNLSLVNFTHDITFGKGEISMLMNNSLMPDFFINHKVPVAFTDDSGRTLRDGLYVAQTFGTKSKEHTFLIQRFFSAANNLGLNYGNQVLHVSVCEENIQHLYSLFFSLPQHQFLHEIINNGYLIKDLLSQYQLQNSDLIKEMKKNENRYILPTSETLSNSLAINQQKSSTGISLIHSKTKLLINLPHQRSQCLHHLLTGKSTKDIARAMSLSPKTIDYYLELLRKELGCKTSKELVSSYYQQVF